MASSMTGRLANENEWLNRVRRVTTELFQEGLKLRENNRDLNRTLIYLSQVFQHIEQRNNVSKNSSK